MAKKYDFSGWATRNDLRCSDGRVIRQDAFKDNDGQVVPLVWNHQHTDPLNVLGHALLENRPEGVYAYGRFNDTEQGKNARSLVQHGDITGLSIYANNLKQQGSNVMHGSIREVSLVLAGANPGAFIDSVIAHGEDNSEEAIIYTGEEITLSHAEEEPKKEEKPVAEENKKEENTKEETVADVFNTLNEKQKKVVYALIGEALQPKKTDDKDDDDEEEEESVKHNVFESDMTNDNDVLSHADQELIIKDAKRLGSLKESFLEHADEYGIENIDYLFPEAKEINGGAPEFIKRPDTWVTKVMGAVHHTPFSRIKSVFADITADQARAKGYLKGNLKKEEVFSLLKRTTTPQTVYKKQRLDRDDQIDITDFDVVAWLKTEMRMMLNEELARAFMFGDGRLSSDDDKINETNIRPIISDADLYTIKVDIETGETEDATAKNIIRGAIKARKDYRGSGNPTLYVGEEWLSNMLLLEDNLGHAMYKTEAELATKMRVKEIVAVPDEIIPEGFYGVIVNLTDYNVGADKGGSVNMFDDFDIDYNQMKYLIETRCSGALTKPYSAIALRVHSGN